MGPRSTFGEGLVEAAQQALAIARGEADPRTYSVRHPAQVDVRAIRESTGLTMAEFALRYGFPMNVLRNLEDGCAQPDRATRNYLFAISRDPASARPTKMR